MRVIMNGLAALKARTGVGHYVARLHAAMTEPVTLYPGDTTTATTRWIQKQLPRGPLSLGLDRKRPEFEVFQNLVKHVGKIAIGIHFALHCRAAGYELYHEPNFIPFATDVPTIITVHDLSVILHPEWHPLDRVRNHERHFLPAIRRAYHLISVSEQVRKELIEILGVSPQKVTAIPNGVGTEFVPLPQCAIESVRARLGLPHRYFLCVGNIEPRKNLLTVLRAFADLPRHLQAKCPLVVVGPWGWRSEPEREFLSAHPKNVILLGYTSAQDLPALYGGAEALLYPSFYEGFGLPPVEALACGTQVLSTRNCSAVREVLGHHGIYLEAKDLSGWRREMKRIAERSASQIVLTKEAISHARRYSWSKSAEQTLNLYRRLLGSTSNSLPLRTAA